MIFPSINSHIYNRIRIDNGHIIDTVEIVGKLMCKIQALTGACEIKCEGSMWVDNKGKRWCPHLLGVAFVLEGKE